MSAPCCSCPVYSCRPLLQEMGVGVRSLLCVGAQRLWVGLACGNIRVYDLSDKPHLLAHWHAHDAAVVSAVQAGPRVYSLGRDGSIRGWSAALPSADDNAARLDGSLVDAESLCAVQCLVACQCKLLRLHAGLATDLCQCNALCKCAYECHADISPHQPPVMPHAIPATSAPVSGLESWTRASAGTRTQPSRRDWRSGARSTASPRPGT